MSAKTQLRARNVADEPRFVVGMDAHAHKLAISIWDWSDRFNPCLHHEIRCLGLDDMVKTYERHVERDSVTIIEASTNSAILKKRLETAGFRAEIVRSDILADKERKRKICDIQDARNLAAAYINGDIKDFVWTPSGDYEEHRDLAFAYRDTVKELTRTSNRIWSFCSRKGYPLPAKKGSVKLAGLRKMIGEGSVTGFARERLEMCMADYEAILARRDALSRRIAEIVLHRRDMTALIQLQGVGHRISFMVTVAVGDVRRFPTAAKFAAFCGFSPSVNTSGDEEERAKARGGTGKPLDGDGRRDAKYAFVEAAQTVLANCPGSKLGKWGWAMLNRGKHRNKVVCAVAHKLALYAYHILRGDPTPNRDGRDFFMRKMGYLHQAVGAKRMHELGHGTRSQFALKQAAMLYGDSPDTTEVDSRESAEPMP